MRRHYDFLRKYTIEFWLNRYWTCGSTCCLLCQLQWILFNHALTNLISIWFWTLFVFFPFFIFINVFYQFALSAFSSLSYFNLTIYLQKCILKRGSKSSKNYIQEVGYIHKSKEVFLNLLISWEFDTKQRTFSELQVRVEENDRIGLSWQECYSNSNKITLYNHGKQKIISE